MLFVTVQTRHHLVAQGYNIICDVVCYGVVVEIFEVVVIHINARGMQHYLVLTHCDPFACTQVLLRGRVAPLFRVLLRGGVAALFRGCLGEALKRLLLEFMLLYS